VVDESHDQHLAAIWRQKKIPVVFRRERPAPLLVKLPYAPNNRDWLRDDRHNIPDWNDQYKAWETPQAWFERNVRLCLRRYGACYVIQLYREKQVCAPACWNAQGIHCECTCMGENHGTGQPGGRWYEIDETLAVSWGVQRYSCRLVRGAAV
jgi:hypothetical protein